MNPNLVENHLTKNEEATIALKKQYGSLDMTEKLALNKYYTKAAKVRDIQLDYLILNHCKL
jgi:hypothetical protein